MQSLAANVEEYLKELPEERKLAMIRLRKTILKNLPKGFKESMSYGMIGYSVPHTLYPKGYHCDPSAPLPFMCIASQKNYIAVYHMGIYSFPELLDWFRKAYAKAVPGKLDMGKSCIRFKKTEQIPYDLIGELAGKITPEEWIERYERVITK